MNKTSEGQACQQTNNTQRNEETNKQTNNQHKQTQKGKETKRNRQINRLFKPTNGCDDFVCLTVCWPSELRAYYV